MRPPSTSPPIPPGRWRASPIAARSRAARTSDSSFPTVAEPMPMIVQRVAAAIRNFTPDERAKILPNGLEAELKRHHYDIASVAMNAAGMAAVFKLVPVSRLLYGSDAPFGSTTVIAAALSKFELAAADITAIRRENALRLFPRFTA